MSTLFIPNQLTTYAVSSSSDLNADFDALYDFVNTEAVHRDGTVPFDALPSIAVNPSTGNHITRYAYAKLSLEIAGNGNGVIGGSGAFPGTTNTFNWQCESGSVNIAFTAGSGTLTFVTGFPHACAICLVSLGDTTHASSNGARLRIASGGTRLAQPVRCGNFTANQRVNYIAIGY